jgi:hypothetical protein
MLAARIPRISQGFGLIASRLRSLPGATLRSATCKTVSGVAWAIVRPFLAMTAFTVVFGRVAGLPTEGGARYPSGFLSAYCHNPWFSTILSEASNQPSRERQPRRQSLFSSPDHSGMVRCRGAGRFRDQLGNLVRADGVVRFLADVQHILFPPRRAQCRRPDLTCPMMS